MKNRIKELREKLDLSQDDLAQATGTSAQQIGRLEMGKRKLTTDWMQRLAPALNAKPSDLMEIESTHHRIKLQGEVQAGRWRGRDESDVELEYFDIPLPEAYAQLRPYALRVVGPSMNNLYPEGTILICCHLEDLNEQPIPGKRYIIDDIDPADGIETTVKEFVLDESGRPWAWPRSSHPLHQEPVALDEGRNGHTIQIKARVVFSLRGE
jgi:transcriptional regulator with XRE-family HTH domain